MFCLFGENSFYFYFICLLKCEVVIFYFVYNCIIVLCVKVLRVILFIGVFSFMKKLKEYDRIFLEIDVFIFCKIDCFIIDYILEFCF